MSHSTQVTLLFVIDDAYAPHLATTMSSAWTASTSTDLNAFVIGIGIRPETRQRVQASVPQIPITWIDLTPGVLDNLPKSSGGTHNNAYALLFAPDLLPASLTRVIALDADLLVRADLEPLWTVDMRGAAIGGVRDSWACWLAHPTLGLPTWQELGLDGRAPYLNSGVMVIDLVEWRKQELTARCLSYLERFGSTVRFADQDPLNAVLGGKWHELPQCWNVIGDPASPGLAPAAIDWNELDLARREPKIVHYAGGLKPWRWDKRQRAALLRIHEWDQAAMKTEYRDWYETQRGRALKTNSSDTHRSVRSVWSSVRRRLSKAIAALRGR